MKNKAKFLKQPSLLPSKRTDDVLTVVSNSNTRNQYDSPRRHVPDGRQKSHDQKRKDGWVPSYV